jgi:hypothetical protein
LLVVDAAVETESAAPFGLNSPLKRGTWLRAGGKIPREFRCRAVPIPFFNAKIFSRAEKFTVDSSLV